MAEAAKNDTHVVLGARAKEHPTVDAALAKTGIRGAFALIWLSSDDDITPKPIDASFNIWDSPRGFKRLKYYPEPRKPKLDFDNRTPKSGMRSLREVRTSQYYKKLVNSN